MLTLPVAPPLDADDGSYLDFTASADNQVLSRVLMGTAPSVSVLGSPGTRISGLACDGSYLWSSDSSAPAIYKVDPADGSIIDTITPAVTITNLAHDGTNLWGMLVSTSTIYKINPATGATITTIPAPGTQPHGIAWDGTNLWVGQNGNQNLYKINPADGAIIATLTLDTPGSAGWAWDGTYLWFTDNQPAVITSLTTAGVVVARYSTPVRQSLGGLAWVGGDLYVGVQTAPTSVSVDIDKVALLGSTPVDLPSIDALSWKVVYRQQQRSDDTLGLDIRVMSGATVLAAADSGGTYAVVSNSVTSTTDVTTGPTAFAYVNTGASKALWDAAQVDLRQRYTTSMGNDGAKVNVDYVELTGTYQYADSPTRAFSEAKFAAGTHRGGPFKVA